MIDPFEDGEAVTPSDSVDLTHMTRCLYVGTSGNVAVVTSNGTTLVFTSVPTGTFIPGQFTRVNATNTTATDIVACW